MHTNKTKILNDFARFFARAKKRFEKSLYIKTKKYPLSQAGI